MEAVVKRSPAHALGEGPRGGGEAGKDFHGIPLSGGPQQALPPPPTPDFI